MTTHAERMAQRGETLDALVEALRTAGAARPVDPACRTLAFGTLYNLRAVGWDVMRAPPDLARIREQAFAAGVAFAEARHAVGQERAAGAEAGQAVMEEIAVERRRQVEVEGWTLEHDDGHDMGQLAAAASCYALYSTFPDAIRKGLRPNAWPWVGTWHPKTGRCDLIRAGALIVAEIERLDRAGNVLLTERRRL